MGRRRGDGGGSEKAPGFQAASVLSVSTKGLCVRPHGGTDGDSEAQRRREGPPSPGFQEALDAWAAERICDLYLCLCVHLAVSIPISRPYLFFPPLF